MQREIDRKENAVSAAPAVNVEDPEKDIYDALKVLEHIFLFHL